MISPLMEDKDMLNPKTTIAGYVGYGATIIQSVGGILSLAGMPMIGVPLYLAASIVGQYVNSAGNVASKDGGK